VTRSAIYEFAWLGLSKGPVVDRRLHSLESRALTHLESIGLGHAAFISMGGPQARGNSLLNQVGVTGHTLPLIILV
jgi:hypothetical protein